jgi:Ca2+-transporting ATPase
LFNALSCRSQSKSIFEVGFLSNPTFLIAVGLSLIGQLLVIYFPPLQSIFHTESIGFYDMFSIVVLCSSVFWLDELRKLWAKGYFTKYCSDNRRGRYSRVIGSERSFGERRAV